MKTFHADNEKGFALVAALMACLILIAIGVLVINMSTGDLFTSRDAVGHKKAMAAVESGVAKMMKDAEPANWTPANHYTDALDGSNNVCGTDDFNENLYDWMDIPGGADSRTEYAVCTPRYSNLPPLPASGYSTDYVYIRLDTTVVGKNESYKTQAKVDVGIGFGPIPAD